MPYSFDLLEQEQKKKANGEENQLGAPEMTGGGQQFTGGGAGMAPASGAPAQNGTNTQGSGFVSLDKYMKANQGNNLGGQVTGNVQNAVNQGKTALDQGASDFTNASEQGATKWKDIGSDVQKTVDTAGAGTTPESAKKIQGYANASYQGPENFLGTAEGTQAQGAAQKASQQAKALQSEGGRFALLDQYFGRPTYNTGQKSLDNLLVQNDKGTAARSQNLNTQANALSNSGMQKTKELDNAAAANKAATADAAKQTRDYLTNSQTAFQKDLTDQAAKKQAADASMREREMTGATNNTYDDDVLAALGLSRGASTYGVDASKYLSPGMGATPYNTATADQYARAKALAQLSGMDDSSILPSEYANQSGTYAAPGLNKAAYDAAVADSKATLPRRITDFLDNFNATTQVSDPVKSLDDPRIAQWLNLNQNSSNPMLSGLTPVRQSWVDLLNTMNGKVGAGGLNVDAIMNAQPAPTVTSQPLSPIRAPSVGLPAEEEEEDPTYTQSNLNAPLSPLAWPRAR